MKVRAMLVTFTVMLLVGGQLAALAEGPEARLPEHESDALLLAMPAGNLPTPPALRTGAAPDVSSEHWTVPTPSDAMSAGLLGLRDDGRFHAGSFVTRQELSAAATRLLVKARAEWPKRARTPSAAARAAFSGAGPAGDLASRADLARVLAGVLCNFEPAATRLADAMDAGTEIFFDVPEGDPRFAAIVAIRDLGLVRGYHDGGYHPAEPVLRMELAESLVWAWRYLASLPDPAPSMVGGSARPPAPPAEMVPQPPVKQGEHWTTDPAEGPDPMPGGNTVRPADGL
ncbi:MAG: S-layer homology domain-containing protein [Armatimonadetes bacterium]|jgi:hypothetical protein|nr:S-layer homology domain-containing protein [Armatimonadota bacterium]MDI9602140.1 S-layer homology domain-containing protein [Acidobacteriota bacterium]